VSISDFLPDDLFAYLVWGVIGVCVFIVVLSAVLSID
jgi:hypothetical protein